MEVVLRAIPGPFLAALLVATSAPARAADPSSESFRAVGSHFTGLGSRGLASPGPRFSGSGVALGQGDAVGWSGGTSGSLTTSAPGFWPIVAGALPTLDADGDGLASWQDDDDGGDGLLDAVESHTGVFAGATDTGTSPVDADTDGDGLTDGDEVTGGSDPNDAGDPGPPAIPVMAGWIYFALAAALACTARGPRGRRRSAR
jgi:hypothetical protein